MFEEKEYVTINPQYGPKGTKFRFSANGFEPSTLLKASIIGPSEELIVDRDINTDEGGRIVFSESTDSWSLGIYTFKVIGKSSDGQKTKTKTVTGIFTLK
jgi:hypothetical protein